jgi:hypothetical protein
MTTTEKKEYRCPSYDEVNNAIAKILFGNKYWEIMMRHAPWSFLLVKAMWKKGEEPWPIK